MFACLLSLLGDGGDERADWSASVGAWARHGDPTVPRGSGPVRVSGSARVTCRQLEGARSPAQCTSTSVLGGRGQPWNSPATQGEENAAEIKPNQLLAIYSRGVDKIAKVK